ncbi:MAG TPA: DUF502 domain-containing protein [Tepidisphaeraceae bacterium]|nr:DUF502 domain-containing protein [Tepidisphaeraceae bacterium]
MSSVQKHLRNTFLAGVFGAIPLVITGFIVWYVDSKTRPVGHWVMEQAFHVDRDVPFLGVVAALVAIYLVGILTTSLLGQFLLKMIDRILLRLPVLGQIYLAWKQIALTPGGTEGIFSKVALIPDQAGHTLLLGFTSGRPLEDQPNVMCVWVPAAPNPVNGRLYFVRIETCEMVDLSTEEAFKIILSTGNYVPPQVGAAAAAHFEKNNSSFVPIASRP